MDFTEAYKHTNTLSCISPNSKYLLSFHLGKDVVGVNEQPARRLQSAPAIDYRQPPLVVDDRNGLGMIMVRFTTTQQIQRMIELRLVKESFPTVTELCWAPDSNFFLAANHSTGAVRVWAAEDEDFEARIKVPGGISNFSGTTPGSPPQSRAGGHGQNGNASNNNHNNSILVSGATVRRGIRFGLDSRHVLIWEEHLLRLSIWSLINQNVHSIHYPKASARVAMTNPCLRGVGSGTGFGKGRPGPAYDIIPAFPSSGDTTAMDERKSVAAMGRASLSAASALASSMARSTNGLLDQSMSTSLLEPKYFAVAERRDCKDFISVYSFVESAPSLPLGVSSNGHGARNNNSGKTATTSGSTAAAVAAATVGGVVLVKSFPVPEMLDLEGLTISPDGRYIAAWDNWTMDYKVAIYTVDGRLEGKLHLPEMGLGVKSIGWSPDSKLLAIGSASDSTVRILNSRTWTTGLSLETGIGSVLGPGLELHHTAGIHAVSTSSNGRQVKDVVVWRESKSTVSLARPIDPATGQQIMPSRDQEEQVEMLEIKDRPVFFPTLRNDALKPNPKIGIQWCEFNADGTLLATKCESMPTVLWIWSVQDPLRPLAVVQQIAAIQTCSWDPILPTRLAWCCGTSRVYIWKITKDEATTSASQPRVQSNVVEVVVVPFDLFEVQSFRWSPDGQCLALMDRDMFCLAFPVDENEYGETLTNVFL